MGADSSQRQCRHAKKLERKRRREAERRTSSAIPTEPLEPGIELDLRSGSPRASEGPKLSMILLELIKPFLGEKDNTRQEMENGITLASAVWNATVLEQQGKGSWQRLIGSFREIGTEGGARIVLMAEAMHQRKLDAYASDLRTVLSWTVTERGDSFNVQVVSGRIEDD